jgi:TonB-linked SusC/RagA family outer membrane protein
MKLIATIGLLFLLLLAGTLHAQTKVLSGLILDEHNAPLPGVTVMEAGNGMNATSSDVNGNFRIAIKNNLAVLNFSEVGYLPLAVKVGDQKTLNIIMKHDTKGLDEVVVVAYSTQKRITNSGAVSSIKASEISDIPVSSIQNSLDGRLPGFFSTQHSGQPGSDAADFYIRGVSSLTGDNQPLIIVDDIQWSYSQVSELNVNEIATITILKDAATTAVYGVRGANGVLLITTKRGMISKPKIDVTVELGRDQVIQYPNYMDAYTTAVLQNEAFMNDSYGLSSPLTLPWSPADLRAFKDNTDPYGHPNVNWQQVLLKDHSGQNNYNINITGGNSKVKYFTSFGYFTQNGLLNTFQPVNPADAVDENYFYNRINFRSNLDITPTKTLDIRFDLNGRFETINNPNGTLDASGLFKEIEEFRTMAPFSTPLVNPNGSYGFANQSWGNGYVNAVDRLANGGYKRNFNNNFQIDVGASQKLDFLTQGLTAKINVSYTSDINDYRNLTRNVPGLPAFYYNSATQTYTSKGNNQYPIYTLASGNGLFQNVTNTQLSLNYDRTFGNNHIYALFLDNQISTVTGAAVPVNFRGLTGRVGYDYKEKYGAEFDIARNGNDLFRPNQQYGVFPAVSAFWNLGSESFFKEMFPFIDLFKFRGSYGLTGSDTGYPTVLNEITYTLPAGVNYFGNGAQEGALINTNVTWSRKRKTDVGLDVNMFNGKFTMSADYFYEYNYDQLIPQAGTPLLIGQTVSSANNGITSNEGEELSVNYKSKIGNVGYNIGGNVSHYHNKIIYISEAPSYPYQAQTGRSLGMRLGYHFTGFYQSSDFLPNGQVKPGVPVPLWSTIQPGDLKYADMNHDGVITPADQTYVGGSDIPSTTYGINFGVFYKGFSINALLQGSLGYKISVFAEGTDAFNGNIQPLMLDSWTPANAATAIYPRIGFNTNVNNITWKTISDYTYVNGDYIRLKSLELGYQVPAAIMRKMGFVNSCRVYVAGYNLLTIRNTGRFQVDPEIANQSANSNSGTSYPITANYTLGIQLGF